MNDLVSCTLREESINPKTEDDLEAVERLPVPPHPLPVPIRLDRVHDLLHRLRDGLRPLLLGVHLVHDDRPVRPSLLGSRSLPRRAKPTFITSGTCVAPVRVQGERTRIVGSQHEPRDRRLERRTTPLGGRGRRQRESSIGFSVIRTAGSFP